jgi:integrase
MASVYEKQGKWWLRFRDHTGRWRDRPLTARTKTEAKQIAREVERKVERQVLGLDPLPSDDGGMTVGQLCSWWLQECCPTASIERERSRLKTHVFETPLGSLRLGQSDSVAFEARFRIMEKAGAAPASINKLRAVLGTVFERARKRKKWTGPNPLKDTEMRTVPKGIYTTLRPEQVGWLLAALSEDWCDLFATAFFAGLRKGELYGLRKTDVDLHHQVLTVARSYDGTTTKGRRARIVPIPPPLLPHLLRALRLFPGELLFPDRQGRMRRQDTKPELVLRRALAKAGIVTSYEHTCRRCRSQGTPYAEHHPDSDTRFCPNCGMRLWPRAHPLPMKFHELRHSTATVLLRLGTPMHVVQKILGHASIDLTVDTYGHLDVEDMRAAMQRLPATSLVLEKRADPLPLAATLLLPGNRQRDEGPNPGENAIEFGPIFGAEHRVRTGDLRLGKATLYQLS